LGVRFKTIALYYSIAMEEQTIEFGDAEVIVRETTDGYEAEEVENNAIAVIDSKGHEAFLHADAEFEVTVTADSGNADRFGNLVIGYDFNALTDDTPNRGNRLDRSQVDGEWDRMRYFEEMKAIRE